jgi:hypothetical protein
MAEQEVVKHTKNVFKIWSSKGEHSFAHKLREFVIEIVIIVFAVTLSIWLHDRSEHKHQQKEVKEFLLGLKDDLTSDMNEMQGDKKAFLKSKAAFLYITGIKITEPLNKDSIKKHYTWVVNTTGLVSNSGRFEGFKSSGKIGSIENRVLQNDIMDLYQENIPDLILSTTYYSGYKLKLLDYCIKNIKRVTDSTSNIEMVLAADESQNLSRILVNVDEIIERYDQCIKKIGKINSEITKEYED